LIYDSSSSSIIDDFLSPALKNSIFYDRGVGYFSSGWLKEASAGMVDFARNGGRARWITSPILFKGDWEAIVKGETARSDEHLKELLSKQVDDLQTSIDEDTLAAIAWMVADEILTFKIAIPTERLEGGDFHDKFGIFRDRYGRRVSFSGSYNDSIKGSFNYESIKVFNSWNFALKTFVEQDSDRFEKLWSNRDFNVKVYEIPNAIKEKIIKFRKDKDRPYKPKGSFVELKHPRTPRQILPRDYQYEAVKAWADNEHKGILDMATGTGKTITALMCPMEVLKNNKYVFIILTCPYKHLIDQWVSECEKFNLDSIKCYESSAKWQRELKDKVEKLSIRKSLQTPGPPVLVAAVTNASFATEKFQNIIRNANVPVFFIADEVHNLGSSENLKMLPENAEFRLGLSATPERWYDETGTAGLMEYFSGSVFTLSLKDAIYQYNVLCRYNYVIHQIELEGYELDSYKELSKKIAQILGKDKTSIVDVGDDTVLGHLLRERANILNNANQKLPLIRRLLEEQEGIEYTLVYTSPQQIEQVNRVLSEMRVISHQITYRESSRDRAGIFKGFEKGDYKVLTAIKCLDEGVDIPKIKTAYLLASTGNPREFTQRRGRILRKTQDKEMATIIDFVAVPTFNPATLIEEQLWAERAILRREFSRLNHFVECAENKQEALLSVYDLASLYGLQDALLGG